MRDHPTEFRRIKFCPGCPAIDQFDKAKAKVVLECRTIRRARQSPINIKLLGVVITKAGDHSNVFELGPDALDTDKPLEEEIEKKEDQVFQQIADCQNGPFVIDGQKLCLATGNIVTDRQQERNMIALANFRQSMMN